VDLYPDLLPADFLEAERRQGEDYFKREYLGIPSGGQVSPFTFDLCERATQSPVHRHSWDCCKPVLIAHDVGRTKDRSTAVVGGISPFSPGLITIKEFEELRQGLYGSQRAEAVASVDRRYDHKTLVIADLSNDSAYAEMLFERLGQRVIGIHIARHGEGQEAQEWRVRDGAMLVYTVGRTHLFDLLLREFHNDKIRMLQGSECMRAYEQLMNLEVDYRQGGAIYTCPSGHHDDLAISVAMLVWAAQHPHLGYWTRVLEPRVIRGTRIAPNASGWT